MSNSTEEPRQQLQATQRALAEAQARCERHDAEHMAATKELEDNRSALLFMLEDLEAGRKKIEQAHREWMAALDMVDDPIFLHDRQFRILRCNKAYQQCAGIPFHELIGQPYYEVFPKNHAPMPCCLRAMNKAEEEEEEEVAIGEAIYRARAFSIHDEQGAYLYSMHTLENITEQRRAVAALHESEEKFRKIGESAQDAIIMMADKHISFWNAAAERIFGYTAAEALGQELHALIVPGSVHPRFTQAFPHFRQSGEGPIVGKAVEVTALRKGGEAFPVELSVSATQFGGQWHAIGIVRDITERKQGEDAFRLMVASLAQNVGMEFFQETVRGLCAWLSADCVIIGETVDGDRVRSLAMQLDGKAIEHYEYALPGTPCNNLAHKGYCEYPEGVCQLFPGDKDLADMGAEAYVGTPVRNSNGESVGILCAISRRKLSLPAKAKEVMEMIAVRAGMEIERKKAEETLKKNEALLSEMGRMARMGGWEFDAQTGQGTWTEEVARIHDMDPAEATSLEIGIGFYQGESRQKIEAAIKAAIADGTPYDLELEMITAKGNHKWVRTIAQPVKEGEEVVRVRGSLQDITERKQAEDKLRESEERHRQIIQTSMDGFWVTDTKGRILDVNDAYCQLAGYTREELLNMCVADVEAKEIPEETAQHIREIMTNGHARFESRHRHKDGQLLDIEVSVVHRADKEDGHLFVFLHDITAHKQAEIAIEHANRALATLSEVNRGLVYATEENELMQAICQAIVKQRAYRMAWIGYKQHDENKSIKIMAHAGHDEGFLDAMQLTWAETERGMGPSGRAVRSGMTQLCQDIANDPHYSPWRDEARKRGFAANIALPLLNEDHTVFGVLNVYAEEVNAFTPGEISLLEEMARDLAFGVRSLQTRRERDLALEQNWRQLAQLQDNLEDTVRAIAGIVEMRDPYTAGHQVRVADLAAAIARQMGLPEEQVHGIHLAGVVHDLGKILVPAEILSKPGKISDIEHSLIKVHPQAGYDILQGIDFTWPVAQMVLQHHERLDGSGYPQGLKGDAILLEARILSVADVVEAMSSHRPYRPGLGIEVALEEITKQRGIHFDPQAVDACLAVFREQGYSFK